jgi:hypothetical protein
MAGSRLRAIHCILVDQPLRVADLMTRSALTDEQRLLLIYTALAGRPLRLTDAPAGDPSDASEPVLAALRQLQRRDSRDDSLRAMHRDALMEAEIAPSGFLRLIIEQARQLDKAREPVALLGVFEELRSDPIIRSLLTPGQRLRLMAWADAYIGIRRAECEQPDIPSPGLDALVRRPELQLDEDLLVTAMEGEALRLAVCRDEKAISLMHMLALLGSRDPVRRCELRIRQVDLLMHFGKRGPALTAADELVRETDRWFDPGAESLLCLETQVRRDVLATMSGRELSPETSLLAAILSIPSDEPSSSQATN